MTGPAIVAALSLIAFGADAPRAAPGLTATRIFAGAPGWSPVALAFDGRGFLWALGREGQAGTLDRIDPADLKAAPKRVAKDLDRPSALAIDRSGPIIAAGPDLIRVHPETGQVTTLLTGFHHDGEGPSIGRMAIDPVGRLWLLPTENLRARIETPTGLVTWDGAGLLWAQTSPLRVVLPPGGERLPYGGFLFQEPGGPLALSASETIALAYLFGPRWTGPFYSALAIIQPGRPEVMVYANEAGNATPVILGGGGLRAVDVVSGPDGALYVADASGSVHRVEPPGRAGTIQALRQAGSPAALLDLLRDPDPTFRSLVRLRLAGEGPEALAPALTAWLGQLNPADRKFEIYQLEALMTATAAGLDLPAVRDALVASSDRTVRLGLLDAISASIDPKVEVPPSLVRDADAEVRHQALLAVAARPSSSSTARRVLACLGQDVDPSIESALMHALRTSRSLWLPDLEAGRVSPPYTDAEVRELAAALGGESGLKIVRDRLTSAREPDGGRARLLNWYAQNGAANDLDLALDSALRLKNPATREAVLETIQDRPFALEAWKPKPDPAAMRALLASRNAEDRMTALKLVGAWKLGAFRAEVTRLASLLNDEATASASIQALGALGGAESIAALGKLAGPERPAVLRGHAVAALASLDAREAALRAAELLASSDALRAGTGEIIAAFLKANNGPEELARVIEARPIPADIARVALDAIDRAERADSQPPEVGRLRAVLSPLAANRIRP